MSLLVSKGHKTTYLKIGIFYNDDTKHIHIAHQSDKRFITTVSADPLSKRGNPNLYWHLAECLAAEGKPSPQRDE